MNLFNLFKFPILTGKSSSEMLEVLCASQICNNINRNNIVEQLIDFCMENTIEAPIAQLPYDPLYVGGVEAIRTAISAEENRIDLAICIKTKNIFFSSKKIKLLVDRNILDRHENDWETFIRKVYYCGLLELAMVDPVSNRLLPFEKIG